MSENHGVNIQSYGPGWLEGVTIHTGSRSGNDPKYAQATADLAQGLVDGGFQEIYYGSGNAGNMGVFGRTAIEAGGNVHGVTLDFFATAQGHKLPRMVSARTLPTMHERMQYMRAQTQAAIALPGSFGTVEEALEWVTSRNNILKPQIIVNLDGYFDPLRTFLKSSAQNGFRHPEDAERIYMVPTPQAAVAKLKELNEQAAISEPEDTLISGDWHNYVEETEHALIVPSPAPLPIMSEILTRMVEYDVSNIAGQTIFTDEIIKPFIFVGEHYKGLVKQFRMAAREEFCPAGREVFYHHAGDLAKARKIASQLDSGPPLTPDRLSGKHAEGAWLSDPALEG